MNNDKEKVAQEELEKRYKKAEKLLNDNDKMEKFLQKLEKKLKTIPLAGNTLSMVPTMISLVKHYVSKEYTDIPVRSIIAVIAALIYFLSPVDVIPDTIPGFGYVDDLTVIKFCLKLVDGDLKDYRSWREKNNKLVEENS